MTKKTYPIVGMHCASCARLLERRIAKVPGVTKTTVNYGNESAFLEIDKAFNEKEFKKAVSDIGYKVGEDSEQEKKKKLISLRRKVIISSILSSLVFILGFIDGKNVAIISLILTLPVQFWAGWEFYQATLSGLKNLTASMDTLVVIGTTSAFLFSVYSTFFGGHIYFDTAAVIITLVLLGRLIEAGAKDKTSGAIKKLLDLSPKKARLIDGRDVNVSDLMVGDIVKARPGEAIATDGVVIDGESYLDEAMITGESEPVKKIKGMNLTGGTINKSGSLVFRVTKVGKDTVLSKIISLVSDAQGSRAEIQRLADTVTSYFVPVVLVLAIITFIAFGLTNAVAVLVIACPCAMGLATPTAIMVAVGRGARMGILIKDANTLEVLGKIKAIIFDKTGTITIGKPVLVNSVKRQYLQIASSLEENSEHPIATALIEKAKQLKLSLKKVTGFKAIHGKGVEGIVGGEKYFLGKTKETDIGLVLKDKLLASFEVSDEIKKNVPEVVSEFNKKSIDVWLVTGDNQEKAKDIGKEAGIKNILSEVLPDQKAEKVKQFKKVAFVGDGVNDAPALALSDVGIAMGTGTDVAIETAGITILNSDIKSVLSIYNLSKATMKVIKQNLFWAFGYNAILIPVAALGLLNPMLAAGAMSLSSVSVVFNSLRLNKLRLD